MPFFKRDTLVNICQEKVFVVIQIVCYLITLKEPLFPVFHTGVGIHWLVHIQVKFDVPQIDMSVVVVANHWWKLSALLLLRRKTTILISG